MYINKLLYFYLIIYDKNSYMIFERDIISVDQSKQCLNE